MQRRLMVNGALALAASVLIAGCGGSEEQASRVPVRTERTIEVTAYELKGSTTIDKLAAPEKEPNKLSSGYDYKPPGFDSANKDSWQVSTYRWEPGQVIAHQGETINFHIFVVNGNEHAAVIKSPSGAKVGREVKMNRGRDYTVALKATEPGVYRLVCSNHEPTMAADILVLPVEGS